MNNNQIILEVDDMYTEFVTQDGIVRAVNGVSFKLHLGETLGIVGESGCGKSVTMLSLMRLLPQQTARVSRGTAKFFDKDLLKLSKYQMEKLRGSKISMIFQDPMTSLNPVLTVGFQIAEPLRLHLGMTHKQAWKRVEELLLLVGIPDAGNRLSAYPHQFSGGMRQRVMIAMALACNPPLLIADEPTTALDVTIQAQILELVKQLRDQFNMSLIWISHDLGVVAGLANRVIVMYAGFIVEESLIEDLYENPSHPYTNALLSSLPRMDASPGEKLETIQGLPPDLINLPKGCPFAARCKYVKDICKIENPQLREVGPRHRIACWVDIKTGRLL